MELTDEKLALAIKYIQETATYKDLSPRYKRSVSHYPELREHKEFIAFYSKTHDRLIPKLPKVCQACSDGHLTHFSLCVNFVNSKNNIVQIRERRKK